MSRRWTRQSSPPSFSSFRATLGATVIAPAAGDGDRCASLSSNRRMPAYRTLLLMAALALLVPATASAQQAEFEVLRPVRAEVGGQVFYGMPVDEFGDNVDY